MTQSQRLERAQRAENHPYRMCARLVMDTTDPDITFDGDGVCNHWHAFQAFRQALPSPERREQLFDETLTTIKKSGRTKSHDCLIGLSGGVDSSYLVHLAEARGLRPLIVHFDNGWNSELAVGNIEKLISKSRFDFETFVMPWAEFRDVQRAYFKASVLDLEVPTDHMIFGALHKIASKRGIKTILSGQNYATEWLMPKRWNYRKNDVRNLKAIHTRFGEGFLTSLPSIGVWSEGYYRLLRGIKMVPLLDLIGYTKTEAKTVLMRDYGWRDYGGKHFESVFTRFYQGHILPRKFGIDKRKAHFSTLILNGEMTRDAALRELETPPYDEAQQRRDKAYVAKKLGFHDEEFDAILNLPNKPHESYGTDAKDRARYLKLIAMVKAAAVALGQRRYVKKVAS